MTAEPAVKDLIVLAADGQIDSTVQGLLTRRASLQTREITADIYVHPEKDPGCLLRGHDFLRPFCRQYEHVLPSVRTRFDSPRPGRLRSAGSPAGGPGRTDRTAACKVGMGRPRGGRGVGSRAGNLGLERLTRSGPLARLGRSSAGPGGLAGLRGVLHRRSRKAQHAQESIRGSASDRKETPFFGYPPPTCLAGGAWSVYGPRVSETKGAAAPVVRHGQLALPNQLSTIHGHPDSRASGSPAASREMERPGASVSSGTVSLVDITGVPFANAQVYAFRPSRLLYLGLFDPARAIGVVHASTLGRAGRDSRYSPAARLSESRGSRPQLRGRRDPRTPPPGRLHLPRNALPGG